MPQPAPTKLARAGRIVGAVAICSVGALILAFAARHHGEKTDVMAYWAAGRQLAHRLNPYDIQATMRLQQHAGFMVGRSFAMRNPPWALFIALPLGFVPPVVASFLWSCGLILALIGSIRLFWARMPTQDDRLRLLSYVSAPAAICLLQQQMSLFLLLGYTLFFCFVESRPFLAGVALLLPAVKPHLALPFWIVLLLWVLARRRFAVLGGLGTALACSLVLSFGLDLHCFQDYFAMVRESDIGSDFIPSLSQLLRVAIHIDWAWVQLVPAGIACCWAVWYFYTHRSHWDWLTHGSTVLLVSVMAAPYAWFPDQSVLLVALMAGLHFAEGKREAIVAYAVLSGAAFIQIMAMVQVRSFWMVWTTPAWLLWFLYATRKTAPQTFPAQAAAA